MTDHAELIEQNGRLVVAHVMECGYCDGRGEVEECECNGPCWSHCPEYGWRYCPACNGSGAEYDSNCTCDDCHALRAPLDAANKVELPEVA